MSPLCRNAAGAAVVLAALLLAACGAPSTTERTDATVVAPSTTTTTPRTTTTASPPCPAYPAATYGIDPNTLAQTGGGSQLVTVVDPTDQSEDGIFAAWARGAGGCWSPVAFPGQPAPPYQAQTGSGGLLPIAQRVPGDFATPTGLYAFGDTVFGNSTVSPTTHYPYHHFVCGDWWDEQPGSPTYDTFQHVPCDTTPPYAADSEALWTEIQPYQHFIDIPMPNPPDDGAGIFLHDDMAVGYTQGCVALPDAELDAVLGWLDPADNPHILITVA